MPLVVWKNRSFTAICLAVFLAWAAFNGIQYFATLTYLPFNSSQSRFNIKSRFQEVQGRSTTTTSLYFIPCVVTGAITNIVAGLLVSRVRANHLALVGALATTIAPAILANMKTEWSYWRASFWAMSLTPLSADGTLSSFHTPPNTLTGPSHDPVLYTISNLAITSLFPVRTQALAGGVFNTLAQIGNSVGLAITSIVAASVSAANGGKGNVDGLWDGYRAGFWTCFGACVLSSMICAGGMRGLGKVGLKVE